ncbi:hypothetical protein IQ06DRAFT_141979 [Phaeosphaeriaceae sp. SRC1lsM3a]|nr:hypothetical protein IQ06DRAFT_141979 [Stagonospora sp. SRC1lsM3a]
MCSSTFALHSALAIPYTWTWIRYPPCSLTLRRSGALVELVHASLCCFTGHNRGSHQCERGSTFRAWSNTGGTASCCTRCQSPQRHPRHAQRARLQRGLPL